MPPHELAPALVEHSAPLPSNDAFKTSYIYSEWIHHNDTDYFLYSMVLSALFLARHYHTTDKYQAQKRVSRTGKVWAGVVGAMLGLYVVFLFFKSSMCPVEPMRHHDTESLAVMTIEFFDDHDFDYWLDYGTLLTAIRSGAMMAWDPDADFGIQKPKDVEAFIADLTSYYHNTKKEPLVKVLYNKNRDIVQMALRHAHTDIWFNSLDSREGKLALTQNDYTNRVKTRFMSVMLPTKTIPSFLGKEHVRVPADSHQVLKDEFSASYMTPRITTIECFECVVQWRAPMEWYLSMFTCMVLTGLVGAMGYGHATRVARR